MKAKVLIAALSLCAISANAQAPAETSEKFTVEVKNLKFNGDIRYRFDHIDVDGANDTSTDQKLRTRLGITTQLADAKFDFRIASGAGRTSTNTTLGGNSAANSNYGIGIDRASFGLGIAENLNVTFGRMGNPFVLVGSSDLVWDSDLNFDGISVKWAQTMDKMDATFSLSRFVIASEGNGGSESVNLNTAQIAVKANMDEQYLLGTVAYHFYENVDGHLGFVNESGNGNTGNVITDADGDHFYYTDDYSILDVGLEFGMNVSGQMVAVYGNYIQNTEASTDDVGYIAGIRVNKLKKKNDWTVYYDYRELEASSTIGAFTDGESFGGGVDGKSHRLGFGYQVGESWYTAVTAFSGTDGLDNGTDVKRYLVDVGASF